MFSVTACIVFFVLIIVHQEVSFCHVCFCMKNWKTTQYNFSKHACFSFTACFFLLLLLWSNNTFHVIYLICYWNTFQYKYNNLIISRATYFKRCLFILYHIISFSIFGLPQLRFILLSSPLSSLFNWPHVQLYLKVPNHIKELTFWSDIWRIA